MSQAPYAVRNVRFGTKFGVDLKVCFPSFHHILLEKITLLEVWKMGISITVLLIFFQLQLKLEDTLWAGLTDRHIKLPMGITAENLAEKYQLNREECDLFAYQSQQKWKAGVWETWTLYSSFITQCVFWMSSNWCTLKVVSAMLGDVTSVGIWSQFPNKQSQLTPPFRVSGIH